MKRSRVKLRGMLFSVLAVLVPLAISAMIGWWLTVSAAQERLVTLAQIASERASQTLDLASRALKDVALTDLQPCSPEGIEQMRIVAMNSFSVESVGYEEDVFACTSWGAAPPRSQVLPHDFITEDGVRVSIDAPPESEGLKPMLALQYAAFNVLVDPEQFREVTLDDGIRVAVASKQGRLLGPTDSTTAHFLALVHQGPTRGLKDGFLYTLVPQSNLSVLAAIPREFLLRSFWRNQLYLLPLGLLGAAGLLTLVIRAWRRGLSPLAALERAVRRQEFIVYYQPIFDITSRRCIGAEALIRWRKPSGEIVAPDLFIPLAEASGLIQPITDQLIHAIIDDLGPLLVRDRTLHVAINLAAADVCSGRFLPTLQRQIQRANVLPAQIWLEVTERSFIDPAAARKTIEQVREAGFVVALDDFGTGYSSLQYLQQLPLDVLKIDRSFIDRISQAPHPAPLVTHVIEMARALHLTLVAEGVETVEQLDYLRANHVEYAQGWLFAKAMDSEHFMQLYLTAGQVPAPQRLQQDEHFAGA